MRPPPADPLRRAFRLSVSPGEEWRAVGGEAPDARAVLTRFVAPLSCLPVLWWTLNRLLIPGSGADGGDGPAPDVAAAIGAGLTLYASILLSVCLLAASIWLLAPLFDRPRDWPRAFAVAAYSSSPLLLGSVLLVLPDLAYLLLLAAFQSAYLLYGGLHIVFGAREDRAAEYVALSTMLLILASTLLGGLGSALGVL